ncbi:hypothetical protein F5Y18DRAFT_424810 [Xylariaceae sp. FL1019]|nr:hypothetical protein F5Y18DRAFT_424810 [Xylariaceae sp. FL1019]
MNGPVQAAPSSAPAKALQTMDDMPSPIIKDEHVGDNDGSSLEGLDWAAQAAEDDAAIARVYNTDNPSANMSGLIDGFNEKDIDQADKADDAVDFEDIDDDDLASETSDLPNGEVSQVPELVTDEDGTSGEMEGLDDLFGDELDKPHDDSNDIFPSSPPPEEASPPAPAPVADPAPAIKPNTPPPTTIEALEQLEAENQSEHDTAQEISDEQWQKMSFEERRRLNFPQQSVSIDKWINQTTSEGLAGQRQPESAAELISQKFPQFVKHQILYFNQLLPEWPAQYMYKQPANKDREPPEFVPTKLDLELDADAAKLFRIPDNSASLANKTKFQGTDDWPFQFSGAYSFEEDNFSESDDGELVGGLSLQEIATICQDWDDDLIDTEAILAKRKSQDVDPDEELDDWEREYMQSQPKAKRPKYEPGLPDISSYDTWGLNDFEGAVRRSSKRVRLDVNDPYLLLEDVQSARPAKRPKVEEKMKRMANGQLRRDILARFNVSNDDAYDALKLNHKSKVRATLSNLAVEHSLPALKLTFPFYRTRLEGQPWEYHRKKFDVAKTARINIPFRKPGRVKRKETKGKNAIEIFKKAKDLTLNDNSTAVLFEYCEQYPIVLSNFGMGSRIINYYRRKEVGDEEKIPKLDLGETHTLLPEDKSPFSNFGTVDSGETVPTLHNEMYRAPIFKHDPRPSDFLLGHTTNGQDGPRWFLRNIDHVYTVGQCLPSLEVPGPHARKVTNTSKNRLKMIAFRMMYQKQSHDVSLKEITPHVFEKEDPQNRQKLKEFLEYNKETKTWRLRQGETMMDEAAIRAMIKPEDVCLVEAMQVGNQLIESAGYDPKEKDDNDDGAEEPLVVQLAPWRVTKNYMDASAGKAMVALHGDGDPTGHGLGFSFIKTSMKGGYISAVQGPLATSADAIERERKANGGHLYNVKKQQDMYSSAIAQIWGRQKATLSDSTSHDDADLLDTANEDDRFNDRQPGVTPAAAVDDGRSQFSRLSVASRSNRRKLKITRMKKNAEGNVETETVVLDDPLVIRNYMKQRAVLTEKDRDVYTFQPSINADENRDKVKLVEKELARLLKNQDRRQVREKQGKGKKKKSEVAAASAASPDPSGDKASVGTTRKCANCGQVGHIKTNKRYWHHCSCVPLQLSAVISKERLETYAQSFDRYEAHLNPYASATLHSEHST